jgi:hypothetical protein
VPHPRVVRVGSWWLGAAPRWCSAEGVEAVLRTWGSALSDVSCYQRREFLATKRAKDVFVGELARVRREYGFRLIGYVVMPNHVHLLVS